MAKLSSTDPVTDQLFSFAPAIAVVGLLLFFVPAFEVAVGTYPGRLHDVMWRFGAVGILSTGLGSMPFGLLLLMIATTMREQRALTRALAIIGILLAIVLVALIPFFVLDSLQAVSFTRNQQQQTLSRLSGDQLLQATRFYGDQLQRMMVSWPFAVGKLLALAVVSLVISIAGLRASKRTPRNARRERTTPAGFVAALGMPRPESALPRVERSTPPSAPASDA